MEEKIRQSNPTLHRYLFTVTTFSKILAMILFISLPFLGFYLGMQYQKQVVVSTPIASEVQKNTNLLSIPAKITEKINYLPLNAICDNGPIKGLTITLNKAYLLSSFADLPGYKLQEIQQSGIETNGLLVLEANVRNLQTSGSTQGIYGSDILRLRRGLKDYSPIIYGATMVAPQENNVIYTYFPVSKDETNFKIMYCNFADHPSVINLDFNSNNTETLTGNYSINKGFTPSK